MKSVTALVADDEQELRHHLIRLLNRLWPELAVVGEADSGPAALEQFFALRPDLVFLDINMPGLSGIEVARKIGRDCTLVFITAYDQYAVDAFESEALDYILKPVREDRLSAALDRCRRRLVTPAPAPPDLTVLLDFLAEKMPARKASPFLQWIRAQQGDTIRLIPVDEILAFRAEDKYTLVITKKNQSLIRKPIRELEKELDPDRFWKISRSAIVNVSAVDRISRSLTGRHVLRLLGHDEPLLVSRAYAHLFRQM